MENINILIVLDNMVVNNFIVIVRVSFLKQLVILLFDWLQICMVFFKVVQKINFNKVNNYSRILDYFYYVCIYNISDTLKIMNIQY